MSATIKIGRMKSLLDKMVKCDFCTTVKTDKAKIKIKAINANAEVFIVSEALAPQQARKSGVNFFENNGVGSTGKILEPFLNEFGQTIYPPVPVVLTPNYTVPPKKGGNNTIYNTEIVHCFPGHTYSKIGKKSIRSPSPQEIGNCLKKGFIVEEIEIIAPKVILLMGAKSYESFYKYILGQKPTLNLCAKIDGIAKSGKYDLFRSKYPLIPIQHASGSNRGRFTKMAKNENLIDLIKSLLSPKSPAAASQSPGTSGAPGGRNGRNR